jgi:RNA polymerase sigma-70 factor (ECF subfamily)
MRTALRVLRDNHRANDVAQDAALLVVNKIGSLNSHHAFDRWVHKITLREVYRTLSVEKRVREHEVEIEDSHSTYSDLTSKQVEINSELSALTGAISNLPEAQRMAIKLRYLQDLSDKEIAAILCAKPSTVSSTLARARRKLRVCC